MKNILTILAIAGVVIAVYSEYRKTQLEKNNNIKIIN